MTGETKHTPDSPIAITGRTFVPGSINVKKTHDLNGNLTEVDIQFEVIGRPSAQTVKKIKLENIFSKPIQGRLNADVQAREDHF